MGRKFTLYMIALAAIALGTFAACKDDATTQPPVTTTGDKVHGAYLVEHVAVCADCHSQRNSTGQIIDSLAFAGDVAFDIPGLGTVYSANITPDSVEGIGAWTDAQIIAAIRTGKAPAHTEGGVLSADSNLFPVMPYSLYAHLTDTDVKDIVAYLRSLKAVRHEVTEATIPAQARIVWAKQTGIPDATPNNAQTQRGKYLATFACVDCHTQPAATATNPLAQGLNTSMFFAGGRSFGPVSSQNITPDANTGIGTWTASQIDSAFAYGWDDEHEAICPPMPWMAFNGMVKSDRDALIAYIRGIPAIVNDVPRDTSLHCPHP
jgi:mono/diheme cytochrome c family protein